MNNACDFVPWRTRRVTNILRVMNLSHESNFGKYHRVLNRSSWDGLALSKILLGLLIKLLPESWPILVAVDETLERRQGKKIKAKGAYRDALRSSQSNVVISYGLKCECMAIIVPLPWCRRAWALPFLTLLSPSKKSNERYSCPEMDTRYVRSITLSLVRASGDDGDWLRCEK